MFCVADTQRQTDGQQYCFSLSRLVITRNLIYIYYLDEGVRNFILKFADDIKVFGKIMDDKDKFTKILIR